jgi:predicted metalloprotease with PDZ domain
LGVQWQAQSATLVQQLAIRVNESALTGIKVSHVLRGGAGERAGLSPGDEVLALDGWRLRRLDDAQRLLAPGHAASLLVARDQRLLTLTLVRPAAGEASGSVTLLADAKAPRAALALRRAWIDG